MTVCRKCGFSEKPTSTKINLHSQSIVTDLRQQLADVESDIINVKALLRELTKKQIHLKRDVNTHSAPILRLPPEISSDIFVAYLSSNVWNGHGWGSQFISPLIFGAICRSWRELAWSTPGLWSSLKLDFNKEIDLVLVDQWLVRSGPMLLSIQASFNSHFLDPRIVAVMDLVVQYSKRWSHIALELPLPLYLPLRCIENRLPNLKCISLITKEDQWENDVNWEIFSVAPRLRVVRMEGNVLRFFTIPTGQLTELCIKSDFVNDCINMLRLAPHVVSCEFYAIYIGPRSIPVHSTRLESLRLNVTSREITTAIFDSLTAPATKDVVCYGSGSYFPSQNFISFVARSSCSLHTLSLHSFCISDLDLMECLRVVPFLQKLSLSNLDTTNNIFRMLNQSNTSGCPLPMLKDFQLGGDIELSFRLLAVFLDYRSESMRNTPTPDKPFSVSPLEYVKICSTKAGAPKPQELILLQDLVQQGKKISIITTDGIWP